MHKILSDLKAIYKSILKYGVCGILIIGSADVFAQNSKDYSFKMQKTGNAWLTSPNAAMLYTMDSSSLSVASALFETQQGKFVNYYQSDNSVKYGLETESYVKLNKKIGVYGKILYSNFRGHGMTGSVFYDPYAASFNMVEQLDTNAGTKLAETYKVMCGIGAKISNRFSIGARVDYTSINYSKTKDLRHDNRIMDMDINIGSVYRFSDAFSAGLDYTYKKRVEGVNFDMNGQTDKTYYTIIDYGAFYGTTEVFGGTSGYTYENHPLFDQSHTASLQMMWNTGRSVKLYGSFAYMFDNNGYYGKNGTTAIRYMEHSGSGLAFDGSLFKQGKDARYLFSVSGRYTDLTNYVNMWDRNTLSSSTTIIVYYGRNEALSRQVYDVKGEFDAYWKFSGDVPAWHLRLSASHNRRDSRSSSYPFYRKQRIRYAVADAFAERNLMSRRGYFTISLGAGYQKGGGYMARDEEYKGSSSTSQPVTMNAYLNREYEYFTKGRIRARAGFKYSHNFSKMLGYVSADYDFTNPFDCTYLSGTHSVVSIKVGCAF
jgi:hypothetical protein